MIFKPASPVKCSTSGCNSSHISTSGKGNRTATSFRPNNSNFFVDFFAHLWYFSAIAALLSKKSSHPGLYPSPGREPLLFSSQISTKRGATSRTLANRMTLESGRSWSCGAIGARRTHEQATRQKRGLKTSSTLFESLQIITPDREN